MYLFAQQIADTVATETPEWVHQLPTVNAGLNGLATVLLMWGFIAIKQGKRETHKLIMLSTFGVSTAFLACYLVYHAALHHYTGSGSRAFTGTGIIRPIYFGILITHVILAMVIAVMVPITMYRGLTHQWNRHRRIAKITFPLWLYVSVTGVVIYFMLYHLG
ncbi:hypothetical protein Pla110_46200 [Polystyrenella longa]|uniref:DUF420 domain-containing protein n=1 Tax=Polystyrenella longa TaxID=2528007 RepID=A0A518CUG0_9PLAN|nr:DUF420 domain-containing protein [Polystyrenella longa]QDU82857.1 hypothetical protein Pla110_46200 [Polystyrenella longa]